MKKDILQIFAEEGSFEGESSQEEAADEAQVTLPENAKTDDEAFEELIRGRYADAFRKRTQGIIDKRLRKMKAYEKTANACEPLLKKIGEQYPAIDGSDAAGLVAAFLGDNGKAAGNEAVNASEVKTAENTDDNESVVSAARRLLEQRAQENLSRYLNEEQIKLREIYPSFSLEEELRNSPEFRHLLSAGVSLRRAFETVNLEKIMGSALRYAVMSAGKKTAETMRNSKRVAENSLQNSASSVMHTDVNSLTGKDIMRILSEVSKGAKISF